MNVKKIATLLTAVIASASLMQVCASADEELLVGGEISKLTYVEAQGGVFHDANGVEGDALQIMAEKGFNFARIRLLDDPGAGHGDGTYYLPAGFMTEEDCLSMARRAKEKSMKIEFTFAYSDFWVDGEKQMLPHKWQDEADEQGLSGESLAAFLEEKVYSYTKRVMNDLIAQGTCPEYVSIGNEVQVGILFNHWQNHNGFYNNAGYLARFLNAGAKAVRETAPDTKIILHSDNGGLVSQRKTFIGVLDKVDFDIIGASYYPYYNQSVSIDNVVSEFKTLAAKYNKGVIVMETGYNWSELRGDGWEGQLHDNGYYQSRTGFGETKEGQKNFLAEQYRQLKTIDGCVGSLYWDPIMLYDGGTYTIGWAQKEDGGWTDANVVSNSNLFDFNSNALPAFDAMAESHATSSELIITGAVYDGRIKLKNSNFEIHYGDEIYNIRTDRFGEYAVAVPYEDNKMIMMDRCGKQYNSADAVNRIINNVNFELDVFKDVKNGKIEFYAPPEMSKMYAAKYDDEGRMTEVREIPATPGDNIRELAFEPDKMFMWGEKNEPIKMWKK